MHVSMSHWAAPEITDDMYDTMQNHFAYDKVIRRNSMF